MKYDIMNSASRLGGTVRGAQVPVLLLKARLRIPFHIRCEQTRQLKVVARI